MTASDFSLTCRDGIKLSATRYPAEGKAQGALVIGSALGVPRKIYRVFAEFLANNGYSVLTFDYRGSTPETSPQDLTMSQWGSQDLAAALDQGQQLPGGEQLFLLGHSIGGQVAGLAHNIQQVKAMVFVASSFPYWKRWPMPQRLTIALMFKVLTPIIGRLTDSFPSKAIGLSSDNMPSRLVLEWAKWMGRDDYLLDQEFGLDRSGYLAQTCPLLAYGFDDDKLVPEASFDKIISAYANASTTRRFVNTEETGPVGHMGFFKAHHQSGLWLECLNWLQSQKSFESRTAESA